MSPILLDTTSFWDVVWWMIMVFFFTMAIWVFISIFADIFRRNDLSGFAKAAWLLLIFILPFLGALAYLIFRPKMTEQDKQMIEEYETRMKRMAGYSPAEEISRAQALKDSGAITAEEFETLKRRALL
jgi:type VI protein secretion system component VasK